MADLGRPFRANYMVRGSRHERVFAALLDVRRFPSVPSAFAAPALDDAGRETRVRPGARLEFTLSATGLTHRVISLITVVEVPSRLG